MGRMRRLALALALAIGVAGIAADTVLAHGPGAEGGVGQGGGRGRIGLHLMGGEGDSPVAVLAELTGLSVEDIHAAQLEGKSLADIAEENGIAVDDLVAALVEQRTARIDELLADGRITEEQATAMKEQTASRVEAIVTRTEPGPGFGAHRGPGRGPRGDGAAGAEAGCGCGSCGPSS